MSLRKKEKEIQRLIKAFEDEAAKFHNIKFSTFFINLKGPIDYRKFESPNHAIMLWQYYGKIERGTDGTEAFIDDLKYSGDFKWGVHGSKLSSFGIIEGESCDLFVRMAKRAGNLFNENESAIIKSRVTTEIEAAKTEDEKRFFQVNIVNDC